MRRHGFIVRYVAVGNYQSNVDKSEKGGFLKRKNLRMSNVNALTLLSLPAYQEERGCVELCSKIRLTFECMVPSIPLIPSLHPDLTQGVEDEKSFHSRNMSESSSADPESEPLTRPQRSSRIYYEERVHYIRVHVHVFSK